MGAAGARFSRAAVGWPASPDSHSLEADVAQAAREHGEGRGGGAGGTGDAGRVGGGWAEKTVGPIRHLFLNL